VSCSISARVATFACAQSSTCVASLGRGARGCGGERAGAARSGDDRALATNARGEANRRGSGVGEGERAARSSESDGTTRSGEGEGAQRNEGERERERGEALADARSGFRQRPVLGSTALGPFFDAAEIASIHRQHSSCDCAWKRRISVVGR
jgi:hypothetical protein